MISLRNEQGKGALRTIIVIIILFLAIYLMVKFFPTFQKSFKFREAVVREARAARSTPGYEEVIIKNLIEEANRLGLDINRGNIKVEIARGEAKIEVDYYMEIQTPFYTFKRHFMPRAKNPIF